MRQAALPYSDEAYKAEPFAECCALLNEKTMASADDVSPSTTCSLCPIRLTGYGYMVEKHMAQFVCMFLA